MEIFLSRGLVIALLLEQSFQRNFVNFHSARKWPLLGPTTQLIIYVRLGEVTACLCAEVLRHPRLSVPAVQVLHQVCQAGALLRREDQLCLALHRARR